MEVVFEVGDGWGRSGLRGGGMVVVGENGGEDGGAAGRRRRLGRGKG